MTTTKTCRDAMTDEPKPTTRPRSQLMPIFTDARALALCALLPLAAGCLAGCAAMTGDDVEGDETLTTEGEEGSGSASALSGSDFDQPTGLSPDERDGILRRYDGLDADRVIPRSLFDEAFLFYDLNKDKIPNTRYVTVVDFSRHSGKKRFFIVDTRTGDVDAHAVAHGTGSDPGNTGYAKRFSNVNGSNASSLGFYLTAETYVGKHGRSLRLDGLSTTNSNVRSRAVVIHGASYVGESRSQQGRSWGCFALDEDSKDGVIDRLKGGSLIYAGLPAD
jgi:hypothetical protein